MENFLTHIHINKIFHLENIDIPIDEKEMKHLIITGKNGSGKTSVLNELVDYIQCLFKEQSGKYKTIPGKLYVDNTKTFKIEPSFSDTSIIAEKIYNDNILIAFYAAKRTLDVLVPKNPERPYLISSSNIKTSKTSEFLKFLIDLKIQEALARNENLNEDAEKIKEWFLNFENLLKEIFEDKNLTLDFNYKDYSFTINQNGNRFGFNQLSDGYSAIIDIVSDLILKMQSSDSLTRFYEKEGIVLIDEIETHLHLELQRLILPFLTRVFPNIQFIVTTHSPFVISSIPNAVVFDLERKIRMENLTEYSYEALAEGYFKVDTDSAFLQNKLNRFKELALKPNRDSAEAIEYKQLDEVFASLNDALAPQYVKGEYLRTKLTAK
jgi:predicted ATP-binding protein involved in virulence